MAEENMSGHEVHQKFADPSDTKGTLVYNLLGLKGNFNMLMQGLKELVGYAESYELEEQTALREIYASMAEIDAKMLSLSK